MYKFLNKEFFKKDILIALICAVIFSIVFSLAGFDTKCDELREKILRLHIIAESDSETDQAIKLKVRDGLLEYSGGLYESLDNKQQAIALTKQNITELEEIAETIVKENGGNQKVNISIGKAYFGTRKYDGFTLPAGEYDAVRVLIGKAKGKNWWCIMFPSMCIPAATKNKTLDDTVNSSAAEIAKNAPQYEMRFKTIEIIESIKQKLKNLF